MTRDLENLINRPLRKRRSKSKTKPPAAECPRCAADLDDRGRCLAQCDSSTGGDE